MKKLIMSTTALVALSGATIAVAADVTLSGNLKIDIETWADGQPNTAGQNDNRMVSDLELWVKSEHFTDRGIRVRPEVRVKPGSGSTPDTAPRIVMSNENGTLTVGEENSVAYSLSLGADWRDTTSGVNRVGLPDNEIAPINRVSNVGIAERSLTKVVYLTPDWQGLQLGYSTSDPGADDSKANTIAYGAKFEAPRIYGVDVAVAYSTTTRQNKVDNSDFKDEINKEYGVAVKYGLWQGSFVRLNWDGGDRYDPTRREEINALTGDDQLSPGDAQLLRGEQSGQEFELIYDLRPHLRVNGIWFKSDAGFKYDVYQGLEASFAFNAYDYHDNASPGSPIKDEGYNDKQGYGYRVRLKADF